jgi:ABC-2 type transport system permease protein
MSVMLQLSLIRSRARIVSMALGFGVFEYIVGLSYASVNHNAIRSLVASLPPALRVLAGQANIASPTGYLGSGYLHPVALTIQGALVISMASAVARDRESGAAELILSRPIAPWRWLTGQAVAVSIALCIVVAGGLIGGLIAVAQVHDLGSVHPASLMLASLMGGLMFLAVAGVTLLISIIATSGARAVGWSAGFVVISYAVNYLASIWTIAKPLGVISIFHHYDPGVITTRGHLSAVDVAALVGLTVVSVAASIVCVQRRELAST